MRFVVREIVVKVDAEDGYIGQVLKQQIYRESEFLVLVPDEMIVVDSDTNKAVITPKIMAFAISDVSDRTGWDIISCKVKQ